MSTSKEDVHIKIKEIEEMAVSKIDDLEGSLLVVKVGSEKRPASKADIESTKTMINEVLKGVNGIRVIVTHHAFSVERIPLPQLRQLQGAILVSQDENRLDNPVVDDLEV